MSWLSKLTGIHLGNIGAPIGALAGSFIGMPQLGAAIGQGVGALGQHKSLGRAAMEGGGVYGGAQLAGMLGGSGGPMSALHNLFSPSSGGGAITDANGVPQVVRNGMPAGVGDLISTMGSAGGSGGPDASGGGGWMGALKGVGGWLGDHPNAIGAGLTGIGQIGQMGAQNALLKGQARQANYGADQSQYNLQIQKQRDAALDPVRRALMGSMSQRIGSPLSVASNPYGGR